MSAVRPGRPCRGIVRGLEEYSLRDNSKFLKLDRGGDFEPFYLWLDVDTLLVATNIVIIMGSSND